MKAERKGNRQREGYIEKRKHTPNSKDYSTQQIASLVGLRKDGQVSTLLTRMEDEVE
jgi:hypothetical protein